MIGKIFTLFLGIGLCGLTVAQNETKIININPDPQGDPWYISGYTPPSPETHLSDADILAVKKANGITLKTTTALPSRIDNANLVYMRTPFNQVGGSCGSASRMCYMFAYELNCYRNADGDLPENKYPSHFTWLLTGQNSGKDQMAINNGVPNSIVYGGDLYSLRYGGNHVPWPNLKNAPDYGWMNGYKKWYKTMGNRLERTGHFQLNTPERLQHLKEWFNNHWGDNSYQAGGVAGAGCAISNAQYINATNDKWIVKEWGPQVDHGTSWSGYDDEISYDFNGDGRITNDIDITGDGVVNMLDWEKGALIMLNSWGPNWKNKGRVYVPYRLLKKNNMGAELYWIRKDYKPRRTMKICMNYSARCELKISVGVSSNLQATIPEKTLACEHFKYAGNGKVPMLGKWADGIIHREDMEFGYDITDLTQGYDAAQPLKYFLKIESKGDASGIGKVVSMSVLNYEFDETQETPSQQTHVTISNGGATTYVAAIMPGGKKMPAKYVSNQKWNVIFADSEETNTNDRSAKNAIDGNTSTFWHTCWSTGTDPYPHEIQVDMATEQEIAGFEYIPRQDGGKNGTIKEFEFYISNDPTNWGEPVSTGNWDYSSSAMIVNTKPVKGRYFRLVSLSEINGGAWTSIAEIRMLHNLTAKETGIEQNETSNIKVWYQNQALNISNNQERATIEILNLAGQIIQKKNIEQNQKIIPLSLKSGMYLVVINFRNTQESHKIQVP